MLFRSFPSHDNDEKLAISETTDGKPPRPGFENASAPAPIGSNGQHEAYWVLSEEDRAKGFVRPVRRSYLHVGRAVCGKIKPPSSGQLSGVIHVCSDTPGHSGECWHQTIGVSQPEAAKAEQTQLLGGCGTKTTMGQALAETYARDPSYYGATFCCHCGNHPRVGEYGEFIWDDGSGERVGT